MIVSDVGLCNLHGVYEFKYSQKVKAQKWLEVT